MTVSQAVEPHPSLPVQPQAAGAPIRTEGLTRRFGQHVAVSDVSLRVPRGGTYGLIGLNGAGKSTTIRMIMGLLPPTTGRVLLNNIDVARDPTRSRLGVGYVPDRCVVHPWMRVGDAIWYCRRLQPGWNDARCAELVKRFRLDLSQPVGKLSKGTAAKLSLLLALAHDPEILILDEPTDGLDPVARDDFLEGVLAAACERDRTVLMSSHNLSDVQRIADHVGLIHEGRLVIQCPTEELVQSTKRLRLVVPDGAPGAPPPGGTIYSRRDGREWTLTVRDFDHAAAEQLRATVGSTHLAVEDVTLDDIFKDFVRGQESAP